MNISSIKNFTNKKSLFLDISFYIAVSLLVSAFLCYFIFSVKISSQRQKIKEIESSMATIGTEEQKEKEQKIFGYQAKINDYAILLKEHRASSNLFSFLEKSTMPKVWFSKISLSEQENSVLLSGESESMEILSQQISVFEKSDLVKKISVLNSSIVDSGKINFNISISLDAKVFEPLLEIATF